MSDEILAEPKVGSPLAGSVLNPEMKAWALSLRAKAVKQKEKHSRMQIFWEGRRPPKFPKGEFVAAYDDGNAYAVECDKVIAWVDSIVEPNE